MELKNIQNSQDLFAWREEQISRYSTQKEIIKEQVTRTWKQEHLDNLNLTITEFHRAFPYFQFLNFQPIVRVKEVVFQRNSLEVKTVEGEYFISTLFDEIELILTKDSCYCITKKEAPGQIFFLSGVATLEQRLLDFCDFLESSS